MDFERAQAQEHLVAAQDGICHHCGEPLDANNIITSENDGNESGKKHHFCCYGCMSVYGLLHSNNLQEFYQYQDVQKSKNPKLLQTTSKESYEKLSDKYQFMDKKEFLDEFITIDNDKLRVHFLIEGIHCLACVWLIERITKLLDFIEHGQVNIGNNVASFTIDTKKPYSIAKLAATLEGLGYLPHAYNPASNKSVKLSNRTEILRIGVAASAMMNIMIYAISNYAGATHEYARLFDGISLAFALPVILFSAKPIFISSLSAIKLKSTSVDIPLAMAIAFGFILSTYNFLIGSGPVYFDSITTLIFLILLSRFAVKVLTQKSMSTKGISSLFYNTGVKLVKDGKEEQVYSSKIEVGDTIVVEEDERIIFDCKLLSEKGIILNTINTGESHPIVLNKGDKIKAGAICIGPSMSLEVEEIGLQTQLGKTLERIESNSIQKNPANLWAQKISKYFTIGIIFLSTIVLLQGLYTGNLTTSFEKILAILIVGCPCAFAIATPIVIATRINKLKSIGIYIKNESSLEELNNTKNLIFDKTGTLTKGDFAVNHFINKSQYSDNEILAIALGIERSIQHPIAIAIKKYAKSKLAKEEANQHQLIDVVNILGSGVSAIINKAQYEIKAITQQKKNLIGLFEDSTLLATFEVSDSVRAESIQVVNYLKEKDINIHLSTGDHSDSAYDVATKLGINPKHIYIEQKPEEKLTLAAKLKNVTFIGDGDNDALAMVKANTSIAIGARADMAMRSCDIYVANDDLSPIQILFQAASNVRQTLRRNIFFAVSYNLVGISLAMANIITPLYAAILMPLSSLTVLLSSTIPLIGFDKRILKIKGKS